MSIATLTNPTGRKTEARICTIGGSEFYFSYETCIGFRGQSGNTQHQVRIVNSWGPTTGRHFNELGCRDFQTVTQEEFDTILEAS